MILFLKKIDFKMYFFDVKPVGFRQYYHMIEADERKRYMMDSQGCELTNIVRI